MIVLQDWLPSILGGIFVILTIVFLAISTILHYHWTRYELRKEKIILASRIYFGVAIFLFLAMCFAVAKILLP